MIKLEVICTYFVLLFHELTKRREEQMKKTLSVFLSFVMLLTCLCVGGISAQAAEKKTKITYLYEPETQTLYIRGKGAVPAYYLGWDECKNDDYNDKFSERDEYYGIVKESTGDGSYTIVDSSEIDYEILIRNIYPSFISTRHGM